MIRRDPMAGDVLVASVLLADGVFNQTVVLVLDCDEDGSLGVILNEISQTPLDAVPSALADWPLELENDGSKLVYSFDANADANGMPALIERLVKLDIGFTDLDTSRSSLEDIFVGLVEHRA